MSKTERKQRQVLFLTESNNYVAITMKEQLETLGYNVVSIKTSIAGIHSVKMNLDAIILFSDSNTASNTQVLVYLKDRIVEQSTPLFLVGDRQDNDYLKRWLPESIIDGEFGRPVDVGRVVKEVHDFLNMYGNIVRKKILVVDDSGAMLRNVKSWLEGKYDVSLANSGTMAIKYLALNRPDLVLLDYEMPVIDGKQVLEMLRSEPEFADVPVFFLTGRDDRESVMEVMSLRPEGYLLKSMSPDRILNEIDQFFERRKAKN